MGKVKAQKRPEEILGLHLRLILGTEIAPNKQTNKQTNTHIHTYNNENQQTLGKRENLISRVFTLLDSNIKFSTKSHKSNKETRKYGLFKVKDK